MSEAEISSEGSEMWEAELEPVPLPAPSRPEQLTVDYHEQPDTLAIHKKRGGGPHVFLLLWLMAWTVGCVVLLVLVIRDPQFGMFLFAVPFWASWLAVAGLLVWMMFGKETLLLRSDEALFLRTALIRLSSRVVPRPEIRGFRECRSSHTENDEYLYGIEMVTLGKPVRFAFRLPDRERAWLIDRLNRFLGTEVEAETPAARTPMSSGSMLARKASLSRDAMADSEVLTFDNTREDPPTDGSWSFLDDIDAFGFWQQGRLHIVMLAGLLFINAFWNGIVSVFVLVLWGLMPGNNVVPQGWEWWGLFVFLIPFEVIGLIMFLALLAVLLEPFRRTRWRFEENRIVRQMSWPVYDHSKAWEVPGLDRLELRQRSRREQPHSLTDATGEVSTQTPFALAFVSDGNVDVCVLDNLTEGEARWMARQILDRRGSWFVE